VFQSVSVWFSRSDSFAAFLICLMTKGEVLNGRFRWQKYSISSTIYTQEVAILSQHFVLYSLSESSYTTGLVKVPEYRERRQSLTLKMLGSTHSPWTAEEIFFDAMTLSEKAKG